MFLVLHTALAFAAPEITPYAGVEFHPFSRADEVWVDEQRTTGTAVGEFDGVVRPALAGFVGTWIGPRFGLHMGVGVARIQTTTWTDETFRQQHWGVVRPSLDLRVALLERRDRRPIPFVLLGGYADIPSARDVSDAYSEEEQAAADTTSQLDRLTLWGFGGRLGGGVDYRVLPGLALGAQVALGLHQSVLAGQDASAVSSWVATEAAFLLIFEWPRSVSDGPL